MAPTNTLDIYLFWFQLDIMKYTVITVDSHWKILIHKHLVYGISPQFIIAFSSNFTFLSCCSWCYSICGLFCFKFIYYDKNRRYFPSLYFSLFPEFQKNNDKHLAEGEAGFFIWFKIFNTKENHIMYYVTDNRGCSSKIVQSSNSFIALKNRRRKAFFLVALC